METVVERPGALDVHKAQVTACVRVPAVEGMGREQHVAEFPTTVAGLLTLRDWLVAHRVTQVTMEATGVFWKPVWAVLEDEFELLLVNARHVKQVPGRKTDVYLAAQYARLKPRRGHKKALGAVNHSIIVACWHMLTTGELYNDLGGDHFRKRDPERTTKRLIAQLEALGHTVTLQQAATA
jgi:hypothetical protein